VWRPFVLAYGVLVLSGYQLAVAGAQSASPATGATMPAVSDCRTAPRTDQFFRRLTLAPAVAPGTAEASPPPFAMPRGRLADPATATAIVATVEQIVACFNAGDFARLSALFTDDYWRREVDALAEKADEFAGAVAAPPAPVAPGSRERLIEVRQIEILADGRVGALVVFSNPKDTAPDPDFLYFVQTEGRWLVDEVVTGIGIEAAAAATPGP